MMNAGGVLAQITAGHFVAGILIIRGRVADAAPIVKYMLGWHANKVKAFCDRKGWQAKRVLTPAPNSRASGTVSATRIGFDDHAI